VRFDLTTLRLFVNAIDHGSIAGAAEREHMVASAASRRIGELESGLGVALLVRQHGGVIPTAAGEALAQHAREVIKTLDRLPDTISTLAVEPPPDIRMLANQTGFVVVLPGLASYLGRRPTAMIRLEESQSLPIIESVAQGSADLGIIGHFQPADRLRVVPYRSIPLMLAVPAAHPLAGHAAISFAEAVEYDLVTLMQGTAIRGWLLAAAARMARKPKFTIQVQSYEAMRATVQAGLAVAVMPEPNIRPYESLLQVRALPLTDDWARMQLNLVCAHGAAQTPALRELLGHLAGP
jgi:DNA-binding transcriptional LysR family regulator